MKRILFLLLCLLSLVTRASEPISEQPDTIRTYWYCRGENISRRVDIYIPAQMVNGTCENGKCLYLLHGINGWEGAWQVRGHAIDTLERLMRDSLCEPVMIVMPDCNKWPHKPHPGNNNLWLYLTHYASLSREHEIEQSLLDLMDVIDSVYHPSDCYIAGLSDGARMAMNMANLRPDRFCAVGMFSPVVHKAQLPASILSPFTIHLYIGKCDIFGYSGKRFHRRLNKMKFPHEFIKLRGNHDWPVWRASLSLFLQSL